jgi:hypothetical protein
LSLALGNIKQLKSASSSLSLKYFIARAQLINERREALSRALGKKKSSRMMRVQGRKELWGEGI